MNSLKTNRFNYCYKHMIKANITIFFVTFLVLFLAVSCHTQGKRNTEKNGTQSQTGDSTILQQPSPEELFDRLLASFGNDWMEREADYTLYPEYYGGAFIHNDGTFVVAVTGNPDEHKKRLAEILMTDNFRVEVVRYSYRQMMKVMDSIDAFLMNSSIPEDHLLMNRFAGAYPDVMENCVKVKLTQLDDNTIRLFRKDVSNSPLITFEKGDLEEWM